MGCAALSLPLKPIRATYRLQLEPSFDFDQAAGIVPYLAALGVSHVYCSPVFEAVPGSRHGYDVVDPTRVRGELGGAEGRARFVATLREHGLGLIADIVPNHVALEGNAWWIDVLTYGTASASFPVFDVDLSADPYAGPAPAKLLIPILGEPYGRELAAGRLRLVIEHDKPLVAYARNRFPLSITSRAALDDEPEGRDGGLAAIVAALNADTSRLHALLEAQHYRLTWWRLARDESPYRRFFDVNGLIGVRVEDPVVFDAMHRLVADWIASERDWPALGGRARSAPATAATPPAEPMLAPVCRRTGLRAGDLVRVWPYDGDVRRGDQRRVRPASVYGANHMSHPRRDVGEFGELVHASLPAAIVRVADVRRREAGVQEHDFSLGSLGALPFGERHRDERFGHRCVRLAIPAPSKHDALGRRELLVHSRH